MKKNKTELQDKERAEKKIKFLEYFKDTPIQKYAGAYVGIAEDTVTDWKKADTDFSDQIDKLKAEYVQKKVKEVKSPEWILERMFKDHFSPKSEIEGDLTVIIKHQIPDIKETND